MPTNQLNSMNNRSIAFQLTIYILATVGLMMAGSIYMNYKFSKKIMMEKIEENAIHQSAQITYGIVSYVVDAQEVTRNTSYQIEFYRKHNSLEYFLHNVLATNPILSGFKVELIDNQESKYLAVFNKGNGEFLILHDEKYCRFPGYDRFKDRAASQASGVWSDPFYCPLDTSMLVISFTKAIRSDSGVLLGYISGQINLNFLNQSVAKMNISKGGFNFIVDQNGTFLTHPVESWIMKRNIFSISKKIFPDDRVDYEALMRSHQPASGFAFPELLDYHRAWFHFSPVPRTNWTVFVIVPAKELFAELDALLFKIIFFSGVGLLLIILIIFLIFRRMLSPLSNIARAIKRLSSEELRLSNQRNEIQILSSSLNDLQIRYTKHLNEVNQSKKDRRKIEKDLKSAKEIQMAIIPAEFKAKRHEIDLFATIHPAETIGGDLYDYFFLDESHLLFAIGDVSGKGIPAALFMAVASTMIKSKSQHRDARQIIEQVNNELSLQNSNQSFLTLFLGILNIETGEFSYCNAAHNYPYILTAESEVLQLDKTHGLPIGVYSSKSYAGDHGVLKPGDSLVLYTDGVTDCRNSAGDLYGNGRLNQALAGMGTRPAKDSVQFMLNQLEQFRGEADQSDDISLMIIRYNGTPKK